MTLKKPETFRDPEKWPVKFHDPELPLRAGVTSFYVHSRIHEIRHLAGLCGTKVGRPRTIDSPQPRTMGTIGSDRQTGTDSHRHRHRPAQTDIFGNLAQLKLRK